MEKVSALYSVSVRLLEFLIKGEIMKLFAGLVLVLASTQTFAATLALSGTVTDSCILNQVTPATYSTLDITGGQTVTVAQTDVTCNHGAGYKLRASSANGGLLVNSSSPNNSTAYTLKIYGTGTAGAKALTIAAQDLVNTGAIAAPVVNEMRNVEAVVTAVAAPWSGTYSDTVTITLTAL